MTKENEGIFSKPVILFCISGQQELHKEGQWAPSHRLCTSSMSSGQTRTWPPLWRRLWLCTPPCCSSPGSPSLQPPRAAAELGWTPGAYSGPGTGLAAAGTEAAPARPWACPGRRARWWRTGTPSRSSGWGWRCWPRASCRCWSRGPVSPRRCCWGWRWRCRRMAASASPPGRWSGWRRLQRWGGCWRRSRRWPHTTSPARSGGAVAGLSSKVPEPAAPVAARLSLADPPAATVAAPVAARWTDPQAVTVAALVAARLPWTDQPAGVATPVAAASSSLVFFWWFLGIGGGKECPFLQHHH